MKEDKVQFNLITWFSQKYVEYDNLLFHVNNKPSNYLKSLGMKVGVSDLVFMTPNYGEFAGIEIKAPESYHKITQIEKELKWGLDIIKYGGFYIISSSLDDIKFWIDCLILKKIDLVIEMQTNSINEVKKKLLEANLTNKKSIKF